MSIASLFSRSVRYPRLSEELALIEIPYLFSYVDVQTMCMNSQRALKIDLVAWKTRQIFVLHSPPESPSLELSET